MAEFRTKARGVTTLCFEPSILDVFILCDNDITWLIIEQRSVALPRFATYHVVANFTFINLGVVYFDAWYFERA